jgi:EF hand domain-containing protein
MCRPHIFANRTDAPGLIWHPMEANMNKIATLAGVLLVGTVVGGPIALAQTAPNSGAGVPGLPGNKSGPAVKPGESTGVRPDQSKVPGLPGSKSGPAQKSPKQLQERAQSGEEDDEDGFYGFHPGMMGPGMMGGGMMGYRYGHNEPFRGRGIMGPMIGRIIFSLMDADGDGKLTLQEFQAAHERIFKAMDTDHDGTVTFEEMQAFMRGH